MLGFLRKVQTSLFLCYDLWNESTNEITPLIDGTFRIATKMPFINANNYYSPVRLFHYRLVQCFLYRSELTVQKSSSTKHIPFKGFIPSFLQSKGNWNTFLRTVSGIIRQYNLHYWEFVINPQLNSSKSLRLWNLWPELDLIAYHALLYAFDQFIHKRI